MGCHEYMDGWKTVLEDKYLLKHEPDNTKDVNAANAVAVVQKKQDNLGHTTATPLRVVEESFNKQTSTMLSARTYAYGKMINEVFKETFKFCHVHF